MTTALVWFRRDLRIDDNPTWAAATSDNDRVQAVYVLDDTLLNAAGPFRRRQLLASVVELDRTLADGGGRLLVRRGDPLRIVPELAASADRVYWSADVSPYAKRRDSAVVAALPEPPETWFASMVHEPGRVLTRAGTLSKIFTPFWRAWVATPLPAWPETGDADLLTEVGDGPPVLDDEAPMRPGQDAALERLHEFVGRVDNYLDGRDHPAIDATSRLSADLRLGTVSPRRVVEVVGQADEACAGFVRQLAWRDWYQHLLAEHPDLATVAVRPEYDRIAWEDDPDGLDAWKRGRTGYPIVDAGMRQLAATGEMHNRVRMIAGSFLVKDLLVDWREGERHFRRLLIDGEIAQNAGNWQWVAGTGTDAAPYFRIFNPVAQSRKFDADGEYIRRWVPELAALDAATIHAPWEAAPLELAASGVVLGADYPEPIVDHAAARDRTLAAYKAALG